MTFIESDNIQFQEIAVSAPALLVTPMAASIIRNLLEQRQIPSYALRVFVAGGGCSGLQYGMAFEPAPQAQDTVIEVDGVRLIVDPTSLMYLEGATIDYVESLIGGGFRIENPNSAGGCGCGKSFKSKQEQTEGSFDNDGGCGTCSSY